MDISIVSQDTTEPVSLANFKLHQRINSGSSEDTILSGLITTARQIFETQTNRAVVSTQFKMTLDYLYPIIKLPRTPIVTLDSFKYLNLGGDWVDFDSSTYVLDSNAEPARIVFSNFPIISMPYLNQFKLPRVEIKWTCGYESVPSAISTAIMILAGDFYSNRTNSVDRPLSQLPIGFQQICSLYNLGSISNWGQV